MCEFCNEEKQLLARNVPYEIWGKLSGYEELQVIIDRGFLRLGYTDDMQCMEHGEKIKINYCPICGNKI
jgi:hypothetical protein